MVPDLAIFAAIGTVPFFLLQVGGLGGAPPGRVRRLVASQALQPMSWPKASEQRLHFSAIAALARLINLQACRTPIPARLRRLRPSYSPGSDPRPQSSWSRIAYFRECNASPETAPGSSAESAAPCCRTPYLRPESCKLARRPLPANAFQPVLPINVHNAKSLRRSRTPLARSKPRCFPPFDNRLSRHGLACQPGNATGPVACRSTQL